MPVAAGRLRGSSEARCALSSSCAAPWGPHPTPARRQHPHCNAMCACLREVSYHFFSSGVCFYSLHREQGVPQSRSVVPRRSVFSLQGPEVLLVGFLHLQGRQVNPPTLSLMSFFLQTISLLLRKEINSQSIFTRKSQTWLQVFMNVMLSFFNLLSLRCI